MGLKGAAFLCLWNGFDETRTEDYENWHTCEHVPERVAAPGFLEGRRYGDFERTQSRYLTLYDLESLAALDTKEYLDLQQRPTPWSARMRPAFRDVLRIPFETVASAGVGCAGHVAVFAFTATVSAALTAERSAELLAHRLARHDISAYHVGHARRVPSYNVFDLAGDPEPDRQRIIILQETTTKERARAALEWSIRLARDADIQVLRAETQALLFNVCHQDVAEKWRRVTPRPQGAEGAAPGPRDLSTDSA